ncbi:MAG: N-acetylmuramoyl-L-alanine amidase [Cellvibrionaceae bacterium]|nr:N-acetylmuramoyl-L-alanine amidase [Cellvibrionaceae bacterium]
MNRRKLLIAASAVTAGAYTAAIYWPRRWRYIVIHHSAGNYGTIEFLQKVHRQRQKNDPIDAIPYHYVIGNGNGLGLGEIASDFRVRYHLWGMHVSANNFDRNFRGIGICLIGNYEIDTVPPAQLQALVTLTKQLMEKYAITVDNISGHGLTPNERTKCPGKHFPMQAFKRALISRSERNLGLISTPLKAFSGVAPP